MAHESVVLKIDDEEASDLYDDIVAIEVELSDNLPSTFRLSIALAKDPSTGSWRYQDEERFRLWKTVSIAVGFVDSGTEDLISGYVTRIEPRYAADEGQSTLEVSGVDASILLDREEKLKDWPDKADSDIAREILGSYPLDVDIDDTEVVHDESMSTIIQRETDLKFLRRLATRNGFDCYVEGTTAHFRRVAPGDTRHPVLAAHFGEETTLRSFNATVDGLRPSRVSMFQIDHFTKDVLTAEADALSGDPLGSLDASALLPEGSAGRPTVYVANNAVTGRPEMDALCQQLFDDGATFVSGEGEVDSSAYQHVLKPRAVVTIKGVGETYSGEYYVSFVRHTVNRSGYSQSVRVSRDALMPTGSEEFEAGGGLLGGLL
jgi:phage protein D